MSRYFIDVHDHNGVVRDEEGAEFETLEDALTEAKASARDIVAECVANQISLDSTCVEVRDESERVVAALTVSEILDHPAHPEFRNHCKGLRSI